MSSPLRLDSKLNLGKPRRRVEPLGWDTISHLFPADCVSELSESETQGAGFPIAASYFLPSIAGRRSEGTLVPFGGSNDDATLTGVLTPESHSPPPDQTTDRGAQPTPLHLEGDSNPQEHSPALLLESSTTNPPIYRSDLTC
jgi:hypothetical protein